jgi:hypothetical protein
MKSGVGAASSVSWSEGEVATERVRCGGTRISGIVVSHTDVGVNFMPVPHGVSCRLTGSGWGSFAWLSGVKPVDANRND